jgi:hypothetical protein
VGPETSQEVIVYIFGGLVLSSDFIVISGGVAVTSNYIDNHDIFRGGN